MGQTSAMEGVAARLRAEALATPSGVMIGSETALRIRLGASRSTLQQAARILEREGLLRVRRGNSGGYFAARPDPAFIEATVASYLAVLKARPEDLTRVATALWVAAVGRAAGRLLAEQACEFGPIRAAIARLRSDAPFADVMKVEERIRDAVFEAIGSPYERLIFDINARFARQASTTGTEILDGTVAHAEFVASWRRASTLQLEAIEQGDAELAAFAARRSRQALHKRVWQEDA